MKRIVYLSSSNVYEKIKAGGGACGAANLSALENIYSEENVYKIFISNNIEEYGKCNVIRFPKHKSKVQFLVNTICNRSTIDKLTENRIISYIVRNKFEIVFVETSIYGKIVRRLENKGIHCIVYFQNIEKDYMKLMLKKNGICYLSQYFASVYNEKLTVNYASCRIAMNERDNRRMNECYNIGADYIVPMTYVDRYDASSIEHNCDNHELTILFVGSSVLKANYDGIKWFVENVMNVISGARLVVVGKGFEQYKGILEKDNVSVIGSVAEIDYYYYKADVIVCPIFYGSGMKTKTAEALMFGKRVMATNEALEGYEIAVDLDGVFCCNSREEFIDAIEVCKNNRDNASFQKKRRNLFLNYYEEKTRVASFQRIISELCK